MEALTQLSDADELVEVAVKPNYRALGKRFGKQTQSVADAIRAADVGPLWPRTGPGPRR